MTDEELDVIEARANAATPGPWAYGEPPYAWIGPPESDEGGCDKLEDRIFMANARTDVPALIAEVRRLRMVLRDIASCKNDSRIEETPWIAEEALK